VAEVTPGGSVVDHPLPNRGIAVGGGAGVNEGSEGREVAPLVQGGAIWLCLESRRPSEGDNCETLLRVAANGRISEYQLPEVTFPTVLAAGPGGSIWFGIAGELSDQIDSFVLRGGHGEFRRYSLPSYHGEGVEPKQLALGPDGAMWFIAKGLHGEAFGRITANTPGSSTTIGGHMRNGETIIIPPPVHRAISGLKREAEAAVTVMEFADDSMLIVKVAAAAEAPEAAVDLLVPDEWDAAEFGAEEVLNRIAADPPDPLFRAVSRPDPALLRNASSGHLPKGKLGRAWKALLRSSRAATAYMRPMLKGIERLKGAAAAGKCSWLRRQSAVAARDAARAHWLLIAERAGLKRLHRDFGAGQAARLSITAAQFEEAQASIAAHGLPSGISAALAHAGASQAARSRITSAIAAAKPRALSLLKALGAPAGRLRRLALSLQRLSSTASRPIRCTKRHHRHNGHRHG
jgi:hypothetical protein